MSEIETAVVIVRPPGYREDQPVTSENLGQVLPDPADVLLVQRLFTDAGFDVSPAYAGSFAITAPAELFASLLPPLPTSTCEGWLAPVAHLVHLITHDEPVEPDRGDP